MEPEVDPVAEEEQDDRDKDLTEPRNFTVRLSRRVVCAINAWREGPAYSPVRGLFYLAGDPTGITRVVARSASYPSIGGVCPRNPGLISDQTQTHKPQESLP